MRWYLFPELCDRAYLSECRRCGMSVSEIAREVGCSITNVETALKNHGLKRPVVVRVGEETREKLGL